MEQEEIYEEEEEIIEEEEEEEEIIEEEEEEEIIEELYVVEESYEEEYTTEEEEESVEEEVHYGEEEIIEEEVIEETEDGTDEEESSVGTFEETITVASSSSIQGAQPPACEMAMDGDYDRLKGTLMSLDEESIEETVAGEEQSVEEEEATKQQSTIRVAQPPAHEMAMDGDYDKLKGTLMSLKAQLEEEDDDDNEALRRGIIGYVDAVDEHGRSALHYACSQNSLSMAVLLLSPPFGADPNQADGEGYPPLYVPCERGYVFVVQILLKFGANADHRVLSENDDDDDGSHHRGGVLSSVVSTPLLAAICSERTEVVKLLLEHGANPNVVTDTDQGKKSALELATQIVPNAEIAALLRQQHTMT